MHSCAEIEINEFAAGDSAPWDAFVKEYPGATFFHLSGWRDAIEKGLRQRPRYLIARRDGQIEGVLPIAEVKSRLFGHSLVSTPGCVYGGVLASDDDVRLTLTDFACDLARRLEVDALELRHLKAVQSEWPTKDLYFTFRKPIVDDDEANMKAIPRKQRAMVRKGIKAGLESEITEDVYRFYKIYSESVRNLGTPVFPRRYFDVLARVFGDACEMSVIRHRGNDIAAVMSFYHRTEVLPYYGGSRPAARSLCGNDYMYWDLMSRAARRGVRLFDYGRSKQGTGSFNFKKNWGFNPQPLYYQYYLVGSNRLPDVNPNNPKYRYFIEAWKRLPLPLANTFGPILARHLG
ncbi:MAG: FemAB family XrtA/PEP-CTERM system-associated protein [Thiohalocapsa sp.]